MHRPIIGVANYIVTPLTSNRGGCHRAVFQLDGCAWPLNRYAAIMPSQADLWLVVVVGFNKHTTHWSLRLYFETVEISMVRRQHRRL